MTGVKSAGGTSDAHPMEEMSLNYGKIELEYREQNPDGRLGAWKKSSCSPRGPRGSFPSLPPRRPALHTGRLSQGKGSKMLKLSPPALAALAPRPVAAQEAGASRTQLRRARRAAAGRFGRQEDAALRGLGERRGQGAGGASARGHGHQAGSERARPAGERLGRLGPPRRRAGRARAHRRARERERRERRHRLRPLRLLHRPRFRLARDRARARRRRARASRRPTIRSTTCSRSRC